MNKNQAVIDAQLALKIDMAINDYITESIGNISHEQLIDTVIKALTDSTYEAQRLKKFQQKIDREAN